MSEAAFAAELVAGLGFTEGPVWTNGGELLVVSMSRGLLYKVDPAGSGATPVAEPGAGPNGLAEDSEGILWIAQNGARHRPSSSGRAAPPCIQRYADSVVTDVTVPGVVAPNDCTIGPDGRLWFTDPDGPAFQPSDVMGRVWALDRATGTAEPIIDGLQFPNGLAFLDDELFVAETRTRRILRFRAPSRSDDREEFVAFESGHPDGIAFDSTGALYVTASNGDSVFVVDQDGELRETITLGHGAFPTNVCFGGCDLRTLFVTAARGGRVLAIERDTPGARLSAARGGA